MRTAVLALLLAGSLGGAPLQTDDHAVIVNSGSTNSSGFRIELDRSGKATRTARGAQSKATEKNLPAGVADRFYAALDAVRPLAQMQAHGCLKSASFGSTLTIESASGKSPDLSCGDHGDAKLKALIDAANEIVKAFNDR